MPKPATPKPQSSQELAFARAFPELAQASTAQIRELRALAIAAVRHARREQIRVEMLQAWAAENVVPLPFPEDEARSTQP